MAEEQQQQNPAPQTTPPQAETPPVPAISAEDRARQLNEIDRSYETLTRRAQDRIAKDIAEDIALETRFQANIGQVRGGEDAQANAKVFSDSTMHNLQLFKENGVDMCKPIGVFARRAGLYNFDDVQPLLDLSADHRVPTVYSMLAMQIPTGSMLLNEAMKGGVAICTPGELQAYAGTYEADTNTITLTTPNWEKDGLTTEDMLTFYEELWHSVQVTRWDMDIPEKDVIRGRSTARDDFLNTLGIEAHAKVGAALMIMEHAENGFPEFRKDALENLDSRFLGLADREIFRAVNDVYEKHGMAAIRANPALLAPAFEAFFRDGGRFNDYAESYFYEMERERVLNPEKYDRYMRQDGFKTTAQDFAKTFGQFLGGKGMLDGRYQTTEDIVNMLPEDSKLRKWLTGEFNPAAEGPKDAAPMPVPTDLKTVVKP